MRKTPVKIIVCLSVLFTVFVVTACKSTGKASSEPSFREPKMFLRSVEFSRISFTGVDLLCKVNVENPNNFEIPHPEITWKFFAANEDFPFADGVIKNNSRINPRSTVTINIPVKVGYLELLDSFISLIARKNTNYKFVMDARIALEEQGNRNWHFEREGDLPILRVPAISFRNIELKRMSLTRLDFEVSLVIENGNSLDFLINNFSCDLTVNNSRWTGGRISGTPRLASGGRTVVPVSFTINSLNIVMDLISIINGGMDVPYTLSSNFNFGVDLPGLKELGTSASFSGMTRISR